MSRRLLPKEREFQIVHLPSERFWQPTYEENISYLKMSVDMNLRRG